MRALTVGELTASIAHELNQPLGAKANNGAACLRLFDETAGAPAEAREALSDIIEDARRASAIIGRVRKLANKSSSEKTRVCLQDVIAGVLALAQRELAGRSVTVQVRLAEHLPCVAGDNLQLQQVILNLVVNAIDAMDGIEERRRVLKIDGRRDELAGAPAVLIAVQDLGCGFKPEDREQLFEPFYMTKTGRMGMGLAISRSIAERHGGHLWAEADPDAGATFLFALPAEPSTAS